MNSVKIIWGMQKIVSNKLSFSLSFFSKPLNKHLRKNTVIKIPTGSILN